MAQRGVFEDEKQVLRIPEQHKDAKNYSAHQTKCAKILDRASCDGHQQKTRQDEIKRTRFQRVAQRCDGSVYRHHQSSVVICRFADKC